MWLVMHQTTCAYRNTSDCAATHNLHLALSLSSMDTDASEASGPDCTPSKMSNCALRQINRRAEPTLLLMQQR